MGYSPERKTAVLKRMLAPNNMAIRRLSQEAGISEATLHKWRAEARGKGQLLPDADTGPEGWTSRDKFAAVLETAAMKRPIWRNIAASGAFLPRRSRHSEGRASRRTTGPESESGPARPG